MMIWQVSLILSMILNFREQTHAKRLFFYGKLCIKACLEIVKTQVVCCGHPQNNYFMLNSNKISHCVILARDMKGSVLDFCET